MDPLERYSRELYQPLGHIPNKHFLNATKLQGFNIFLFRRSKNMPRLHAPHIALCPFFRTMVDFAPLGYTWISPHDDMLVKIIAKFSYDGNVFSWVSSPDSAGLCKYFITMPYVKLSNHICRACINYLRTEGHANVHFILILTKYRLMYKNSQLKKELFG